MTFLSAHKGGAGSDKENENTLAAITVAAASTVEFVEFDVQRCADGTFVVCHDVFVGDDENWKKISECTFEEFQKYAPQYPTYEQVLRAIAGKKKAHLDFKFVTSEELIATPEKTPEVEAVKIAIDIMGAENIIVTTMEDASVLVVRQWSKVHYPELLVGLSLGRDTYGMTLKEGIKTKLSELFPDKRFKACDANLMVCKYDIGRQHLVRWAKTKGLPILVWTVDDPQEMEYWLKSGDAWLVTTNFPEKAAELRQSLSDS